MVEHRVTAGRDGARAAAAHRTRARGGRLSVRNKGDHGHVHGRRRRVRARENGCEGPSARVIGSCMLGPPKGRGLGLTDARTRVCRRHARAGGREQQYRSQVPPQPTPSARKRACLLAGLSPRRAEQANTFLLCHVRNTAMRDRGTHSVCALFGWARCAFACACVRSLARRVAACDVRRPRYPTAGSSGDAPETAQVRKCHTHVIIGGARQYCARRARN